MTTYAHWYLVNRNKWINTGFEGSMRPLGPSVLHIVLFDSQSQKGVGRMQPIAAANLLKLDVTYTCICNLEVMGVAEQYGVYAWHSGVWAGVDYALHQIFSRRV